MIKQLYSWWNNFIEIILVFNFKELFEQLYSSSNNCFVVCLFLKSPPSCLGKTYHLLLAKRFTSYLTARWSRLSSLVCGHFHKKKRMPSDLMHPLLSRTMISLGVGIKDIIISLELLIYALHRRVLCWPHHDKCGAPTTGQDCLSSGFQKSCLHWVGF